MRAFLSMVSLGIGVVASSMASGAFAGAAPPFKKILIVVLENTDFDKARKQKFLGELAKAGATLTDYHAQTHPSQPNYIALVAGSAHGVDDLKRPDSNVTLNVRHVGDLLEAKGLAWKAYAEGYPAKPGKCFLDSSSGDYARKHVPFLSFSNVQSDPARCDRIVDDSRFDIDAPAGQLPDFSLYIPDLDNDGHDKGVAFADRWLRRKFQKLLADPVFTRDLLFVVTFDEGRGGTAHKPSHILTILFGDAVVAGSVSAKAYSHYSLLRLVEDTFGLGNLGQNDVSAETIDGIWK